MVGKMKKVAIIQSNYIPWKGYFDLINDVDEFVLYDDMQYTKRDWRNRNKILTPRGLKWLTIPTESKGKYLQKIKDTLISDPKWHHRHLRELHDNYRHARYYDLLLPKISRLYEKASQQTHLSQINYIFLTGICSLLGIDTHISFSMEYPLAEGKTERLVDLCRHCQATHYISGPSAREYIDTEIFSASNIQLEWKSYANYPKYNQLGTGFEHGVTILDLLFNMGPESSWYIWGWRS